MFLPLHDQNPIKHIRFPYVTYGLMGITALVFLLQSVLPPAQFNAATLGFGMIPAVINQFAADPFPALPPNATFFTYAFLHADWMHLLSNMLFLWIFGDNIEDALGHVKFLLFYLLCAALAAAAHILFNDASVAPLIGASGAVAGVMGAYVLLFPHARLFVLAQIVIPIPLPVPAFWMLGFWVLTQVFYVLIGSDDPVAWWAHLGGFAAGIALALILKRRGVKLWGGR
jgi:membrane associated rhomboid family serine protease